MNHTACLVSESRFLLVLSKARCRKIVALSFICADTGERRIKACVWILPHVANTHRPPRPPAPALAATSARPTRRLLQVTTLRQGRDEVTLSRYAGTTSPQYNTYCNNFEKTKTSDVTRCAVWPTAVCLSVTFSSFPVLDRRKLKRFQTSDLKLAVTWLATCSVQRFHSTAEDDG